MRSEAPEWCRQYAAGATYREIAARFGVDEVTVRRVVPESRRSGPRGRVDVTAAMVVEAVAECGSQSRAAVVLGVSRMVVRARLFEVGLGPDPHARRGG